jgi:hypothetical protein
MGGMCGKEMAGGAEVKRWLNGMEADDADYSPQSDEGGIPEGTNVYMIVIALDYPGTGNELTCTKDGDNMIDLWQQCGLPEENVQKLYNNDGNKENVINAVTAVAPNLSPGDFFIFYYSGHGTSVPDKSGDEADGKDEALCLVTPDGELDWSAFMTDDDLADLLQENIPEGVNTIVLSDCCHSGSITDFDDADWGTLMATSISGCADDQTSGDTGNGGIFTHSMLMGIQAYSEESEKNYSVGQLYNKTLKFDDETFNSKQDITAACTNECESINHMSWPLVPDGYTAPMNR